MPTTAWAHLPNAAHIGTALADLKARPRVWAAALDTAQRADWTAAWAAARGAARSAARDAAGYAARDAARSAAWDAAWGAGWAPASDAMDALIAWDDSADLLDLSPDALRTLIDVAPAPVCHQAALLLPWAIVRETT